MRLYICSTTSDFATYFCMTFLPNYVYIIQVLRNFVKLFFGEVRIKKCPLCVGEGTLLMEYLVFAKIVDGFCCVRKTTKPRNDSPSCFRRWRMRNMVTGPQIIRDCLFSIEGAVIPCLAPDGGIEPP